VRQLPYALSTAGTTSIEDLSAGPHGDLWFQLFVLRDRGLARSLLERAEMAGYSVLEVTVDTPVSGWKKRDMKHGLTVPPALRAHAVADIALHVGYWARMLSGPALRFANLGEPDVGEAHVSPANMANLFDPTVTWDDIAEVRGWWRGPMLLKGPLGAEDCKRAASLGIDGVHLSNHGGRQLDRCVPSAETVAPAREALGDGPAIVVDSGVRHGADIVVALAMGADLCAIGRPYLYGLAVAGDRGVGKVLDILVEQVKRTMKLIGIASVGELKQQGGQLLRRRAL
jgi:L-lactate dehydrogenase (cytochrome)